MRSPARSTPAPSGFPISLSRVVTVSRTHSRAPRTGPRPPATRTSIQIGFGMSCTTASESGHPRYSPSVGRSERLIGCTPLAASGGPVIDTMVQFWVPSRALSCVPLRCAGRCRRCRSKGGEAENPSGAIHRPNDDRGGSVASDQEEG